MSDSKAGEALASWLTKQEAADKLQTSVRSIERRIAVGEIEARKRRKSGPKHLFETVVNPVDLEKLLPAAHIMPIGEQAPAAGSHRADSAAAAPPSTNFYDFFQALLTTFATNATTPHQAAATVKNWLTLAEAAEHSGLSETFLKRQCQAGNIKAVRDGREWKIHRPSLDAFQPEAAKAEPEKAKAEKVRTSRARG
jgi:excisionase family DNA binding protein